MSSTCKVQNFATTSFSIVFFFSPQWVIIVKYLSLSFLSNSVFIKLALELIVLIDFKLTILFFLHFPEDKSNLSA